MSTLGKCGPPDGAGVQGGRLSRGGPRGVLRGGQRAGHQVRQGAQTQVMFDTKQYIAYVFAIKTTGTGM